jgi:hypothetical protein
MASGMTSIYCPKYLNWTNLPRRKTMVTDGKMFHVRPQKGKTNGRTCEWRQLMTKFSISFCFGTSLSCGRTASNWAQMTQRLETECTRDFRPMLTALYAEHLIRSSAPTVKKTGHLQAGASSASSPAQRKCAVLSS